MAFILHDPAEPKTRVNFHYDDPPNPEGDPFPIFGFSWDHPPSGGEPPREPLARLNDIPFCALSFPLVLRKFITFLVQVVAPHFSISSQDPETIEHLRYHYWKAFELAYELVHQRYARSSLRPNQVVIFERVFTCTMLTFKLYILMQEEEDNCSAVYDLVRRTKQLVSGFLASSRVRSERLEILLVRYLDEDRVNLVVAEGVEMRTMIHELSYRWMLGDNRRAP